MRTEISTSDFGTPDFITVTFEKMLFIIENIIPNNMNKHIIISDIDIQFFQTFHHILDEYQSYDIVSQREQYHTGYNTGFMYVKCNEKTLFLF